MPKILVVEEGSVARESLGGILASAGIEAVYAGSTTDALNLYCMGGIDMVLTEVRMPVMDGILLARKLRRFDPDAVVICMTALERKDDLRRAIREGVFDFFVKPFSAHELTDSLLRAVAFRSRIQAVASVESAPDREPASPTAQDDEALYAREAALVEREAALVEREAELASREAQLERAIAEFDEMGMSVSLSTGGGAMPDESELSEREAAVSAREQAVAEQMELIEEREAFLEQSENALFEKGQRLQELETELDHRAEGLGPAPVVIQNVGGDPAALAALEERSEALDERERDLEKRFGTLLEREKRLKRNEALVKAREQYLRESESILFAPEE